jgi:hypothetical protein
VAQVHATGHGDEARIRGIPASIADPLFQPVAQGGLGLAKLQFFSPRNGFRYFPPQPTRSSTPVSGITGNTLHEFPYPDLNQFFSETDHILCEDIPDPPYNAGP